MRMRRRLYLLPLIVSLLCSLCRPLHAQLETARKALLDGRVEESASLLHPWIEQHAGDAEAHLLLCRAYYAEDRTDAAVSACETSAAITPDRSDIQLWLGRAEGMKARSANPFFAFSLARKVRDAFERSVRLDSLNVAAAGDLGEFYVAAPAVVGGGATKARSLATRLQKLGRADADAESHRILGLLAEKEGNSEVAEEEFRQAAASNLAGAWVDLGGFYARQHQPDRAAAAVHNAVAQDRAHGAASVDAASVLVEAGREPELARKLLQSYLDSAAKSDAAPAFKVHIRLGDLLARSGDRLSAHREYALALSLAPDYPPARRAVALSP